MLRDELIEELQRCPYNNEVKVRVSIHPDYFDNLNAGDVAVEDVRIDGVISIPQILIDCEQARP